MEQLKPFNISDRIVFAEAYKAIELPLADLSYGMMAIWNNVLKLRWTHINRNLCVFAEFEESLMLWGPPLGGEKIIETLGQAFSIMEAYNKDNKLSGVAKVYYIPEELRGSFSGLPGYELCHQGQDYVYLSAELAELKGPQYAAKRNLRNFFIQNYVPTVELFDELKHKKACLDLLDRWMRMKQDDVPPEINFKFNAEAETARNTINLASKLQLRGIVVLVDSSVEGFTFGEEMNPVMANVMVEKTNLRMKGMPQFIYSEFVKRCFSSCKYINAGEDWDVPYLRHTKESYHPAFLLKSYCLRKV